MLHDVVALRVIKRKKFSDPATVGLEIKVGDSAVELHNTQFRVTKEYILWYCNAENRTNRQTIIVKERQIFLIDAILCRVVEEGDKVYLEEFRIMR